MMIKYLTAGNITICFAICIKTKTNITKIQKKNIHNLTITLHSLKNHIPTEYIDYRYAYIYYKHAFVHKTYIYNKMYNIMSTITQEVVSGRIVM